MDEVLKDLSTSALTEAIKANLFGLFHYFKLSNRAEIGEDSNLICWHTDIPHPWFNGVLWTGAPSAIDNTIIQDTLTYYKSHQVATFSWWFENSLLIQDWKESLLAQGFQFNIGPPGMAIELATLETKNPPLADLEIKQVVGLEMLHAWVKIFIRGFQIPDSWDEVMFELFANLGLEFPIRHYIGYLTGEPVAVSTLFLSSGVAGIYNVATLPEARKRGIGAALTLKPLYESIELGYHVGILQSSEIGFSVYQGLGFKKYCDLKYFIFADQDNNSH